MDFATSPSQIATADRCLRRWWWQSVKGFKAPPTASTQFGSDVHAAIEHHIQQGYWPDVNPDIVVRAKVAYNALVEAVGEPPHAVHGDRVEQDWSLPASDDYALPSRGRIDLVLPYTKLVDWKTTSDMRYCKSPAELAVDPQVILYSDAMLRQGLVRLPLDFLHVYTVTRGKPAVRVVRTRVTPDVLSVGRQRIGKTMQRMAEVLALHNPTSEDVPENVLACGDFGGCPHRDRCFGENKEENVNENKSMSIAEKLAARKVAQAGGTSVHHVEVASIGQINPPDAPQVLTVDDTPPEGWNRRTAPVIEDLPQPVEAPAPKKRRAVVAAVNAELSAPQGGDTLLIGAMPLTGPGADWVLLDVWAQPFITQACETLKVAHWTLADYGKGKAAIVALVAAAASAGRLPSHLIIDRRSALGDAVADVLIPHYRNVFCKMG